MQKKNKVVGIFTPFPQIIGGGERFIFTLAESFSQRGYNVEILSPFEYDLKYLGKVFGLKLKHCYYKKTATTFFFIPTFHKKYTYFFALSNHILPPVFGQGRDNTLIIQFPFPYLSNKLIDKLQKLLFVSKLKSYQKILTYSNYSKKWIKKRLPKNVKNIPILILHPPVTVNSYSKRDKKENIILSVGRFFAGDHNKQHAVLIKAFKELVNDNNISGWELHIAGYLAEDQGSKNYFKKIAKQIEDYPVYLHPNISSRKLIELYKSAKIFWHAAGYNNNENITPEKSEHFGIVVTEAMSAGNVPIVVNAGGLSEIVNTKNGYKWRTIKQLKTYTTLLIKNDFKLISLTKACQNDVKKFDILYFYKKLATLYTESKV